MRSKKSAWSRRFFLKGAGMSPFVTGLASAGGSSAAAREGKARAAESIYAELKVRTLINGRGVATFYSSTLMPPEVHRAMERASEYFVEIVELQKAVGARLAGSSPVPKRPWVCSGSAACIAQATAGCIAGTDPEKISRLPDTEGLKNEVILTHRMYGIAASRWPVRSS